MGEARVMIIGLGDLARRLALRLATNSQVGSLILAGRSSQAGSAMARLVNACSHAEVQFVSLDALNTEAVRTALLSYKPDLLFQSGSLMSPFALQHQQNDKQKAIQRAGFAMQVSAHLPILMSVMTAVRSAGFVLPVVNASYPDLTHPMLHPLGLSPTTGIGNAGMIRSLIGLHLTQAQELELRVVAHHSQVRSVVTLQPPAAHLTSPLVFIGDMVLSPTNLFSKAAPMDVSANLNSLTAFNAANVISALLSANEMVRTSLPGVGGRQGGLPIVVQQQAIKLDLPATLSEASAANFLSEAAKADGIGEIDARGTLTYTKEAQECMASISDELAHPLHASDSFSRWTLLKAACHVENQ